MDGPAAGGEGSRADANGTDTSGTDTSGTDTAATSRAGPRSRPLRVLRLCSVYEAPGDGPAAGAVRFDPVGGMQTHTGELTRALDEFGVVQTVVTTRPPGALPVARLANGSRVVRLGWPIAHFRQFYAVPAARLAPRFAAQADLIHAHLGEDLAVVPVALAAARRNRIPLVLTVHTSVRYTLSVTGPRSALLKALGGWWERHGERRADQVIALTPRLARILVANGVPADRVRVIPSGVRPALFAPPDSQNEDGRDADGHDPGGHDPEVFEPLAGLSAPRVVFLGRLHPQKNVDLLLKAAARLKSPDVHVVLVGDGPHRRPLEELCDRLGLRTRVTFLGFVGHDHVPAVLRGADVLVMPSRYEELGTALVEAMYSGVPVVAARTGGIPDLVTDGVNGLLVAPDDVTGLAEALDRLLADPGLRRRLGEQGRQVAAGYRWDRLARRVLEVYGAALLATESR